jgi:chorismate mutase
MSGHSRDIYNVDTYTDAELYKLLDLSNPSDRELEAKILHMIWKYNNFHNESGKRLVRFFQQIYDRFLRTARMRGRR